MVGDVVVEGESGDELTITWDGAKGGKSLLEPRATLAQDRGGRRLALPKRHIHGRPTAVAEVDDREIGRDGSR